MATCWCYVFFTPAPRFSEGGRLGRAGKRERYKVMPYSVMSTLYQHMLASLVRELRKSTILGEQAKQT